MKYLRLLLILLAFQTQAQYGYKTEKVNHRFKPGFMWFYTGLRPADVQKPRKYDRLIFDVYYSNWMANDRLVNQRVLGSIGFSTNLMWDIPLNSYNGIGIGIGFQHKFQRIAYTGLLTYDPLSKTSKYLENGSPVSLLPQFQNHVFGMPLEIRFRKKAWKQLKINIGGSIGYRPFSKNKFKSSDKQYIYIQRRVQDINPLDYEAHVRFGFRSWALFASYGFSNQFKAKQSDKINIVSVGLSISLF